MRPLALLHWQHATATVSQPQHMKSHRPAISPSHSLPPPKMLSKTPGTPINNLCQGQALHAQQSLHSILPPQHHHNQHGYQSCPGALAPAMH